jgi:hypothetical protein
MKKGCFVLFLVFTTALNCAFCQPSEPPVVARFLVKAGAEFGGDEILQVLFTNGQTQTMRAGQGGYLGVCTELQFSNAKQFMLRAAVGIKYTTTAAENANIRLTSFPSTSCHVGKSTTIFGWA